MLILGYIGAKVVRWHQAPTIISRFTSSSYTRTSYLREKVAIVTGSTEGIGYAIAKRLAYEGSHVVVSSRKQANVDRAVETLHAQGLSNVSGIVCHVGKREDRQALVEHAIAEAGGIDIFVSNVGINPYLGPTINTPEKAWDKVMDINLKSAFQLTQQVVPHMIKRGGGAIVYVSSFAGLLPHPVMAAYSITKAGLMALTKMLATDLAQNNIRVNCLAPGIIDTKMTDNLFMEWDGGKHFMKENIAFQRLGKPDEMAGLAAFLCSEDASFITGEIICATGGAKTRI